MKHLLLLVKKDLRLLVRSKSSALIVIFAPLLIILLLGLSYNTSSLFGLTVGVHSPTFSDEVTQFTQSLEAQDFTIIKYKLIEDCIEDIKFNSVHTCVSLPENFQVQDNVAKEVTFYLDQSKINLVWIIQQSLEQEFSLKSQELSQTIVNDILGKISTTKSGIEGESGKIVSLKDQTQSASASTGQIGNQLDALNLNAPSISGDDTLLTDTFNTIGNAFNTTIVDIESALQILDNITGTSSAQTLINSVKSDLVSTQNQLKGSSTGDIASAISSLESEIDILSQQIVTASTVVNNAAVQNQDLSSSLSATVIALAEVSNSLDSLKNSLGSLSVSDAGTISTPLITKIEKISADKTNLNYAFPSLLALIVMFLAIMLGNTIVMMEKTSPAYIRNFMIPVKKIVFVLATLISNIIIIIFQLIVILLIALAFIPESLPTFPLLFVVLFLAGIIFTLVGMLIGYLFSTEETGILASISTGSLFLFLSGLILPIEGMSKGLRAITAYNPFVMVERLIREVFIFESQLVQVLNEIGMLALYIIILFLVIMVVDSFMHKHFMHRVVYRHHKKTREKRSKQGNA
jgi:ABC-type polysaccharide/polyol phosphate export permease